jgi:hypothetical protein
MSIHPFPITSEHAITLVREAVACGNVLIPDPPDGGDWYLLMTRRQVDLCLREGDLVDDPWVDEHGHVRCALERFGAGMLVRVHIVLMKQEENWRLLVIEVENRL